MDDEEWRDIPSVPQMMGSSWGRVKLKPYAYIMHNGGVRNYNPKPRVGREMLKSTGRDGIPKRRVIYIQSLKKSFSVARLVCEAFHGPCKSAAPLTLHIDENPSNNRPENLKWGTQKENLNMPKVQAFFRGRTGEKSPRAIWKKRKDVF